MEAISDPSRDANIEAGARNLLLDCVGIAPGDRLLLVCEARGNGYYDEAVAEAVARVATELGARTRSLRYPLLHDDVLPADLGAEIDRHHHTVFFSRIGDQIRFWKGHEGGTRTMCYALDIDYLGSPFAGLSHRFMEELKAALEAFIRGAATWRVTCPLGTDVTGRVGFGADSETRADDFTLRLFPVTTFQPVSCRSMTGKVALARWLVGTGSRIYDPNVVDLDAVIFAAVEGGRIRGFSGHRPTVRKAEAHYDFVAAKFGIDRDRVHSWHAGINPRTFFPRPAETDLERWAGVAFGSPRYLHFHTCGDYPPGEICWSLFDCSVWFDDALVWDRGRFAFVDRPAIAALMARHAVPAGVFDARPDIGI